MTIIDKIQFMLKERKIWFILRGLEEKTNSNSAPTDLFVSTVLEKNSKSLPWMRFRDRKEVMRIFQSLVYEDLAWHVKHRTIDDVNVDGVQTEAKGDGYFKFIYFWPKLLDAVGFWRVAAIVIGIVSFVPNGIGYKIIDRLLPERLTGTISNVPTVINQGYRNNKIS